MSGVESRVPIGLDRETSRRNFLKTAAMDGRRVVRDGDRRLRCRRPQGGGRGRVQDLRGARRRGDSAVRVHLGALGGHVLRGGRQGRHIRGRLPRADSGHPGPRDGPRRRARHDARAARGRSARDAASSPSRAAPSGTRRRSWSWRRPSSLSASAPTRARRPRSRARTSWPRPSRSTTPSASTGARSTY